jgi:hypothetical protein
MIGENIPEKHKLSNIRLALETSSMIGCDVLKINENDIVDGK